MVLRTLLGSMRMQCGKNTHIFVRIFEFFVVYVYIIYRGQCMNKERGL
jgi:hypothetical protein